MKIKIVPIGKIIPYARNPRKTEGAVPKVAASIKEFGFRQPIVVDAEMVVICGHTRLEAARVLGLKKIPIHVADDLTEAQRKAYRLADNRTAQESSWDDELLNIELLELKEFGFDMELTGFDDRELVKAFVRHKGNTDEDDVPEPPVDPITQSGDLWLLGNHRLLCGDASLNENIKLLVNGTKPDILITDPPYGINVVKRNKIGGDKKPTFAKVGYSNIVKANYYRPIENDDKPFDPSHLLELADRIFIFGGNYFTDKLPVTPGWFVWDKNGGKEWNDTFADCELIWSNLKIHSKIYRCLWKGMVKEGESGKRIHPTQKPVKLISELIRDFSNEGEIVIDLYLGSGTTMIASEMEGRVCYGMEIDPIYCDVIVKRWEEFTGERATCEKAENRNQLN